MELKCCPFCGCKAMTYTYHVDEFGDKLCYGISCAMCPCTFDQTFHTEEELVQVWNRRV